MAEFVIRPFKRTHPGRLPGCECHLCRKPRPTKPERLAKVAAEMRAHYLTHGSGCKRRAQQREKRLACQN